MYYYPLVSESKVSIFFFPYKIFADNAIFA